MAGLFSRWVRVSPARLFVADLLDVSRQVPTVIAERPMRLGSLVAARAGCTPRPSWGALFIKAFGLVAGRHPPLRRVHVPFPWAHFYEHPDNIAAFTVERHDRGEPIVVIAHLPRPEQLAQVANRVASRQAPFAGTLGNIGVSNPKALRRLNIVVSDLGARGPIEEQLELHTKRWVFLSGTPAEGKGPGTFLLAYDVRPRKKLPETLLLSYLRTSAADRVREVSLEPESTP